GAGHRPAAPDARSGPGRGPRPGGPRLRVPLVAGNLPRLPARELLVLGAAARRTPDRLLPALHRRRRGARAQHLRRPQAAGAGPGAGDDGQPAQARPPAPRRADLPGGPPEQPPGDPPVRVAWLQRDRSPAALLPVAGRAGRRDRDGDGVVFRLTVIPACAGMTAGGGVAAPSPFEPAATPVPRAASSSQPAACAPARPPPRGRWRRRSRSPACPCTWRSR